MFRNQAAPLAGLALLTICCGCGGAATVPVIVERPALIDARTHGSTLSIEGFAPGLPDYQQVAGQLGRELAARVKSSGRELVKLQATGGGLLLSGRLERYESQVVQKKKQGQCDVRFNDGEVQRMERRACTQAWIEWTANVSVVMKVQTAAGKVLYHRRLEELERDATGVVQDAMPAPPNLHATLRQLRHRVVERMARVVVPRRVEASATFYGCAEPAAPLCGRAIKHFAASRFDQALASYVQAEAKLRSSGASTNPRLADLHWNRAMVARYARRYDRAVDELEKARRLDADRQRFKVELTVLRVEQRDQAMLIESGLDNPPPRGH